MILKQCELNELMNDLNCPGEFNIKYLREQHKIWVFVKPGVYFNQEDYLYDVVFEDKNLELLYQIKFSS